RLGGARRTGPQPGGALAPRAVRRLPGVPGCRRRPGRAPLRPPPRRGRGRGGRMRLIRLELAGFGAFRSPTTLTFDDADFFALVGPTGSGKSTILDAVCFALYGSVPRYGSENLIRYVVTLGASEARVRLDFELAGEHYIATRVARRTPKGVVATKEARLERVTGADTTEVVAGFEREMSAAVVQLLGLRFDDFTRCVALPQGDFARFLRAKGDERRELLLRLLNLGVYTDLGVTARRLEAEARSQIALIDGQLEQYAFAPAEALAAARRRPGRRREPPRRPGGARGGHRSADGGEHCSQSGCGRTGAAARARHAAGGPRHSREPGRVRGVDQPGRGHPGGADRGRGPPA